MTPEHASRMSRVDTAWLRMDNDVNLMMIVGVWVLTPAVSLAALRERVQTRLLQYRRFRQKAVADASGGLWVDDAAFDLDRHVVVEPLPTAPGQAERDALKARCGELAVTPLDPARPLWQFHLVERYEGGSAVIIRIHHCIADGIALISVMNSITDGGTDPPRPRDHHQAHDEEHWLAGVLHEPFGHHGPIGQLAGLAARLLGATGDGMARSIDALAHPQQSWQGSVDLARSGAQVLGDVAALALMTDDSPTLLKGRPVGRKRVAWDEPMPLDAVKAVGKALGCSVNDVLLSCVSGAIGHWLRAQGDDPDGKDIRAMVPVNLRPLDQAWQLGNHFGLAPLTLPVGIANPVERVYAVRERMAQLKGSYQPLLAYAILSLVGLFVKPVQDAVLGLFARKSTAVMTNVPGPRVPLTFCGSTLRQTLFWVPSSGDIGVGVSILSYAGGVQFGLITDEAMCAEPQAIVERFAPEFEQLLLTTLMLPWGEGEA